MNSKIEVGQKLPSKNYGEFEVVKYVTANEIYVKFMRTGYVSKVCASNIRKGLVRDNLAKTVHGVGCFGDGPYKARLPNNGPCTKQYATWNGMMFRCYGDSRNEAILRNYGDCTVCEDWHNFQNFAAWCDTQPEMNFASSSIDKDIRSKGNRVYSPTTCCFVPQYINTAITGIKHQNMTGKAGVWKFKDSYISEVTLFGAKANLGVFPTAEQASYVRDKIKAAYISALADAFKNEISEEVYKILKRWEE